MGSAIDGEVITLARRPGNGLSVRRLAGHSIILVTTISAALGVLAGCDVIVEKHCLPGEVVISNLSGGSSCGPGRAGDRKCPDGQVLERQPELRRERCIPDRVDRPASPSAEWLPSTED